MAVSLYQKAIPQALHAGWLFDTSGGMKELIRYVFAALTQPAGSAFDGTHAARQ